MIWFAPTTEWMIIGHMQISTGQSAGLSPIQRDGRGKERFGVIGLDLGGRVAFTYAARRQREVAALCVAYAPLAGDENRPLPVIDALEMLPMPVLGLYGADDESGAG